MTDGTGFRSIVQWHLRGGPHGTYLGSTYLKSRRPANAGIHLGFSLDFRNFRMGPAFAGVTYSLTCHGVPLNLGAIARRLGAIGQGRRPS